ncbi:hypothetical protein SAMN04515665_12152 [Blastococcus sp. DSM 46786]|uniref:hypothetical protein n=1 Tax=Blastococcus sp. DSM 46786 TaxID=1798227 RepID=UPI0008AA806D|nr:hypothetical protein [Blastococcus sp. DSM 46786]SEL85664.1 hypothetical protein SAMN04515665_12152 [Blastococcus sp. DSM 46786]
MLVAAFLLPACVTAWELSDLDVLARALERLMPTGADQVLGAAALPLVAALVAVAGARRLARGRSYPAWLKGLTLGPALAMLLLAAPPGRNDPGSVVRDAVPVFVACTWVGLAALAAGWFATLLHRSHREERVLRAGRPDLLPPPEPPAGARAILVRAGVAYAVALCVVAPVLALG